LETATLGKTGLRISRLGAGLAAIGEELTMAEVDEAGRVLNAALDGGILFLDTSACYFISEELVGRTISHRRDEYVLATKCGHASAGYAGEPWAAQTIRDTIDRSLTRLKTDHVDLLQLHSCDVDVLERGEATEALMKAKQAGKTRFIGYSGDNEAALWAVESGLFDTLQTSFSLLDQHARTRLFGPARAKDMGIIIKRPIANGAWGAEHSPSRDMRYNPKYSDEYFRRAQLMAETGPIPDAPEDRVLLAMGFVFAHPEVDTAIVGTRNPDHMAANIRMVENDLPISTKAVEELHRRFDVLGDHVLQQN
jgi:aryl-alcohol dehydrogenase-like predicted oxidoreductase